jgi:hypothetical protein
MSEITVRPIIPRKVCDNHDAVWCLMGYPCPRCKRISLFAYDYDDHE